MYIPDPPSIAPVAASMAEQSSAMFSLHRLFYVPHPCMMSRVRVRLRACEKVASDLGLVGCFLCNKRLAIAMI